MTKEQLIALGLDDATATKVAAASVEELKNYVSKADFDKEVIAKKQLETDIKTRDKQLEELKKVDEAGLQKKIEELQETNKTTKTEYEAKFKQMQVDSAVNTALTNAKAKNLKAVRALLDLDKAELDGETVKGLSDQIKKLQSGDNTKFLFDSEVPTGGKPQAKSVFGMQPVNQDKGASGTEQSLGASFAAKYNAAIMPVTSGSGNATQQ